MNSSGENKDELIRSTSKEKVIVLAYSYYKTTLNTKAGGEAWYIGKIKRFFWKNLVYAQISTTSSIGKKYTAYI